jgi:hypothetical protein
MSDFFSDYDVMYHINELVVDNFVVKSIDSMFSLQVNQPYERPELYKSLPVVKSERSELYKIIVSLSEKLDLSIDSKKYILTNSHPLFDQISLKFNSEGTLLLLSSNDRVTFLTPVHQIDKWKYCILNHDKLDNVSNLETTLNSEEENTVYLSTVETQQYNKRIGINVTGSCKPDVNYIPKPFQPVPIRPIGKEILKELEKKVDEEIVKEVVIVKNEVIKEIVKKDEEIVKVINEKIDTRQTMSRLSSTYNNCNPEKLHIAIDVNEFAPTNIEELRKEISIIVDKKLKETYHNSKNTNDCTSSIYNCFLDIIKYIRKIAKSSSINNNRNIDINTSVKFTHGKVCKTGAFAKLP